MTGRHVLILLATAAVALCVLLVGRALDSDDAPDLDAATRAIPRTPAATAPRTEPTPAQRPPAPPAEPPPEPVGPLVPEVPSAPGTAGSTGLDPAEEALRELTLLLRSARSTNEDLLAALLRVQAFYLHPPRPLGVEPAAPDPHGAAEPILTVPDSNLRLLARDERWPEDYLEEILTWRRKAEKQFLKALTLQQVDRTQNENQRNEVNIKAAKALAATRNANLAKKMIRSLEKTIFRAKYAVPQAVYEETLGALAQLGNPDALEWMREEFTHAKRSPQREVDRTNAAHRAMVRFDRELVASKERYLVVREMVKTYAGVESNAEEGDADYATYWQRVGKDAIRVLQYYAFDPRNADGEPLATVAEFQAWFRTHKDPRKQPWTSD